MGPTRASRPEGDTGGADPAVTAALASYAAGEATEHATLTVVAASRLLVPIVAVLAESNADGTEKETEMALPTLIGSDGRKAVIAFTGMETLHRWRPDARPVPVPGGQLWQAALTEADAVVVDIAGPVPLVVEGARLRALASGEPPPPAYQDPDIQAVVTEELGDFALEAGGPDADLLIAVPAAESAEYREALNRLLSRLQPRLRRIQLRTLR